MVKYLNYEWLREAGENIRVHGNRFIQIDLADGTERVHIWHDLVPFAQAYSTPIHDHVFGFRSHILAGTLIDIRYKVAPVLLARTDAVIYDTYTAQPRHGSDTELRKTGELVTADISSVQAMPAGSGYVVQPREFHTTAYVGYAVTKIRKQKWLMNVTPRVLCPVTMQPDNEFERYKYSSEELWAVVGDVLRQANKEKSNVKEGSIPV